MEYNNLYQFEFSIVAKKRGIYTIGMPDAIHRKENAKNCNDEVTVILFNNNLNNNLQYYKDSYYEGVPVPPADSVHSYSFKVK